MAGEDDLVAGLESVFGDEPAAKTPPAAKVTTAKPEAAPPEPDEPETIELLDDDPDDDPAPTAVAAEPEYEIEVDGQRQTVKGADQVKELLQKGAHYSKNSEVNARVREALLAQSQQLQNSQQFHAAVFQDLTHLRAIDAQLEQFNRVDWSAAYESDPFKAMQLKEQRDQLREARSAKVSQLQAKEQQFQQGQAQAAQQLLHSESQALAAKLPEMRNSDSAKKVQGEIASYLTAEGFNQAEIASVMDHRMVVVARKAALYDQLVKNKDARLKQVRDAPPVVRPGAVSADIKGKADVRSMRQNLRKFGRDGNHRAQEALVTKALERAFK